MPNDPQGQPPSPPANQNEPDKVEEADLESFPASDPPTWTGTRVQHEPLTGASDQAPSPANKADSENADK